MTLFSRISSIVRNWWPRTVCYVVTIWNFNPSRSIWQRRTHGRMRIKSKTQKPASFTTPESLWPWVNPSTAFRFGRDSGRFARLRPDGKGWNCQTRRSATFRSICSLLLSTSSTTSSNTSSAWGLFSAWQAAQDPPTSPPSSVITAGTVPCAARHDQPAPAPPSLRPLEPLGAGHRDHAGLWL